MPDAVSSFSRKLTFASEPLLAQKVVLHHGTASAVAGSQVGHLRRMRSGLSPDLEPDRSSITPYGVKLQIDARDRLTLSLTKYGGFEPRHPARGQLSP